MLRIIITIVIGAALGAFIGYVGKCTTGACPLTANPWRGAGFGALIAALIVFSGPNPLSGRASRASAHSDAIEKADSLEALQILIQSSKEPVVVDFYADWCGPCRRLAPEIAQLADKWEGKAKVVKINVDQQRDTANAFDIRSIPDVRVFMHGNQVQQVVGFREMSYFDGILAQLVNDQEVAEGEDG